jgi:lysophospholipase L1-like esterase
MRNVFAIGMCLIVELIVSTGFAQKKIAVLGSSTAAGYGASVPDSSWVGRLQASFRKNTTDGIDTLIDNRAVPSYVTYQSLPTGYPVPAGRPLPDPYHNVTYILNDIPRADVVIINYPTNDIVNGYDPKEMMDNLRIMFQQFNAHGIPCFISTSQPRNTSTNDSTRMILRQLVDSINNNFKTYAIDFWDDLVTSDGTNMLRADLTNDGIHPNDTGHRYLFQRVAAKNILSAVAGAPLGLTLKNWQAKLEASSVKINWSTVNEELNTVFEIQRGVNGNDFQKIYELTGTGQNTDYSWTDASPLTGKSFYRLKIIEPTKTSYSAMITIVNDKKQLVESFYADASQLRLKIYSLKNQPAEIDVINLSGALIKKQTVYLTTPDTNITIPLSELAKGEYFLRVITSDASTSIKRFVRTK